MEKKSSKVRNRHSGKGRESSVFSYFWMPVFAGTAELGTYYKIIN